MRQEVQSHLAGGSEGRQVDFIKGRGCDLRETGQSKPPGPDAVPASWSFSFLQPFHHEVNVAYVNSEAHRVSHYLV